MTSRQHQPAKLHPHPALPLEGEGRVGVKYNSSLTAHSDSPILKIPKFLIYDEFLRKI